MLIKHAEITLLKNNQNPKFAQPCNRFCLRGGDTKIQLLLT